MTALDHVERRLGCHVTRREPGTARRQDQIWCLFAGCPVAQLTRDLLSFVWNAGGGDDGPIEIVLDHVSQCRPRGVLRLAA